jgi:putative transposase
VKRSLLVDGAGGPLAVVVAGANRNDHELLVPTLRASVGEPPADLDPHLCLDAAYDRKKATEQAIRDAGYTPHIRRIGEEKRDATGEKTFPARRWVVERTISWLNGCRAILTRYDKKARNYLGLIQLDCILLWYRRYHRLCLSR